MKISDLVYPELKTTDKLKYAGDNFTTWKLKMDFVFADYRVDYVLTDPIPAEDDADRRNQWLSDDNTCRLLIFLRTEEELHRFLPIYGRSTAKSMMNSINTRCNYQSMYRRRVLFSNFRNHRMSEGNDINRHIFEIRALARKLEMGGVPMSDEIQAVVLMSSLPDSWANVVEGLIVNNADKEGELSLDNVCRRLMVAGEVRWRREGGDDGGDYNLEKICYYCGKPGHFQANCLYDEDGMMGLSEMVYPELKTTLRLNHMGTQFDIWKSQLSTVLDVNKVNYVLTDPKPPEVDAGPHKKWLTDDFTCRHIILGAMEDDLFLSFHHLPTAKVIMKTLDLFFNSPSLARQMALFDKYVGRHMSGETNVRQHIVELGGMAMEMETAGIAVSDEMQAVVLMESLPESWENEFPLLTVNMDKENGLSLDKVSEKLRVVGDIRALTAQDNERQVSNNKSNRKAKRMFRGNCYSCGRPGHCQSNCPY